MGISARFDGVYDITSTQEEIFENEVRHSVDKAFEGFNATILAYGSQSTTIASNARLQLTTLCM